jgi:hypothetical protein
VWGCPVYVLDPKLQDGKKLLKWNPCPRWGQFRGISAQHSSKIGRILNLQTGHIKPQYHCVYDDQFTTVPNAKSSGLVQNQPFNADSWESIVLSCTEHIFETDNPPVDDHLFRDFCPSSQQVSHHLQPILAPEGERHEGERKLWTLTTNMTLVFDWTTVRMMLILSIILNLAKRQVDYTEAFVHAPNDKDPKWDKMSAQEKKQSGVYLEMPRGFKQPGNVLKLNRSLYGLHQSPRSFFQHLKAKLEAIGFESQESMDAFLFISDKVIVLAYVDDTLLLSPEVTFIN